MDILVAAMASAFVVTVLEYYVGHLRIAKAGIILTTQVGFVWVVQGHLRLSDVAAIPASAFLTLVLLAVVDRLTEPRVVPRGRYPSL